MSTNSSAPEAPRGELRYGFVFGGLRLVPASRVLTELVADAAIFAVPGAPPALAGVINLHGTIVPVFDAERLDSPRADLRPQRHDALVFDRDEQRVGLLLGAQPQLLTLQPAEGAVEMPAGLLATSLRRAWREPPTAGGDGAVWWEFDHHAAFALLARGAATASENEPANQVIA